MRMNVPHAAIVLAAVLQVACVALRPYEEVLQEDDPGTFLDVDGQKVHVEVQGEGEPLVLVHGFGASTYSWRHIAPELAGSYRTIALDLSGFGYTERPREPERYSRSGQLRLITGVLDALGHESAHFAGHSYGGGLVLTLAHQQPERVRSLILIDTTYPDFSTRKRRPLAAVPPLASAFVRGLGLRRAFVARSLKHVYYDDELVTDEVRDAYRERLRVEGAVRAYRALTMPHNSAADRASVPLEEIEKPVLAIWGEDDRLTVIDEARRGAARLPDVRFEALDECGHSPMEEHPQKVVELIESFLEDVRARAARG